MKYITEYRVWEGSKLARLVQLGMTPNKETTEWILELLAGDPDFELIHAWDRDSLSLAHLPTGTLISIFVRRRFGGELSELVVRYTSSGENPERSEWISKLEPDAGPFEVAELALGGVRRYLARLGGEPIKESVSLSRLHDLGLTPNLSFVDWVADLLAKAGEFSVQKVYRESGSVYLIHEPTGIMIGITLSRKRTGEPKTLSIIYTIQREPPVHRQWVGTMEPTASDLEVAELAVNAIEKQLANVQESSLDITRLADLGLAPDTAICDWVEESEDSFDRLLDLGLISTPVASPWGLTVARLRHRFPDLKIKADPLGTNLKVFNRDQSGSHEVYLEADWNRHQYEGTSLLVLTLQRSGQWQPIRSFSQAFAFDMLLRNKGGKKADPQWVGRQFADLIAGYIETWLLKDK